MYLLMQHRNLLINQQMTITLSITIQPGIETALLMIQHWKLTIFNMDSLLYAINPCAAHWRMGCSGNTSSSSSAALSAMPLAPQLRQNTRRLQLNATRCSWWHSVYCTPRIRVPTVRIWGNPQIPVAHAGGKGLPLHGHHIPELRIMPVSTGHSHSIVNKPFFYIIFNELSYRYLIIITGCHGSSVYFSAGASVYGIPFVYHSWVAHQIARLLPIGKPLLIPFIITCLLIRMFYCLSD